MSMFPSISIAGSGLSVDQTWIDAIGGNIANAQDQVTPGKPVYREQSVVAVPQANLSVTGQVGAGNGVQVQAINLSAGKGILTYDPTNPIANKQGYVLSPKTLENSPPPAEGVAETAEVACAGAVKLVPLIGGMGGIMP